MVISDVKSQALNARLETSTPQEVLEWAFTVFGAGVVATSSLQTQSVALLHMISETAPEIPIIFLDTGFHFPETLAFRDELANMLKLNIRNVRAEMGHARFKQVHGELYRRDPDLCCYINKVAPLEKALENSEAWISGIRRDQTQARSDTRILSLEANGKYKVCPLALWTEHDVWRYMHEHNLPDHPLFAQGYPSIGCAPCTRAVKMGENARAGRWEESAKTECGLHTMANQSNHQKPDES